MVINMKINIYYGGRGLIDDPTLFVIGKMQEVLEELRVKVERFNLYELKNGITALPQSLKDADGIILATNDTSAIYPQIPLQGLPPRISHAEVRLSFPSRSP